MILNRLSEKIMLKQQAHPDSVGMLMP